MEWSLRNDLPVYTQLVDKIKLAIISGELPPGARINSVRDLALEAGVNPNTMQRALAELERAGLVYTQRTAGRFVTEDQALIARAKEDLAEIQIADFLKTMNELGYGKEQVLALLRRETEGGK